MDLWSPSATSCPKAVSGPCPRAQPFPVLWFKTSPGHHWHVYANPLAFLNAKAFEPGTEATYGIKNWGCTSGPNPSRRSVPLGRPYLAAYRAEPRTALSPCASVAWEGAPFKSIPNLTRPWATRGWMPTSNVIVPRSLRASMRWTISEIT